MNTEKINISRNYQVDAVRGAACIIVCIYHCVYELFHRLPSFWESALTEFGNHTVSLFFCISGYLVCQSIEKISSAPAIKSIFYVRRAFRILPLWWLLTTLMYAFDYFPAPVYLSQVFMYYGFLAFDPIYLPIVPAWSLFTEEIFYFFVPWVRSAFTSLLKVAVLFLFSIAITFLWRKYAAQFGVPTGNYFIGRSFFSQMPFFVSGNLILHLQRSLKLRKWLFQRNHFLILSLIGTSALASFAAENIYLCFFTVPIFFQISMSPKNIFSAAENIPGLTYAGKRCYGIYLLHHAVKSMTSQPQHYLRELLSIQDGSLAWYGLKTVFVVSVTITLAAITFRLIEAPLIRMGYKISNRWAV